MNEKSTAGVIGARDVVLCGFFAALTAVGAFIKIMLPIGVFQVTFSLQLLFALMAGLVLGSRKGLYSVMSYLLIGLAGVPVFAHGGGPAYLMRPTFGFLAGFAAAAWLAGAVSENTRTPSVRRLFLAAFLGEMAYYACGLAWYYVMFNFVLTDGRSIGLKELFLVWFCSTVIPDTLLSFIAARMADRLIKTRRFLR